MQRRRRMLQRVEMLHVAGYPVRRVEVSRMGHRHRGQRRLSRRRLLPARRTAGTTVGRGQARARVTQSGRHSGLFGAPGAAGRPGGCGWGNRCGGDGQRWRWRLVVVR